MKFNYIGAIRTPLDAFHYTQGPCCVDHQRKEIVLFTRDRKIGRLKLVRPQLPMAMVGSKLLDRGTVPVAGFASDVLTDPSNNTWGEVKNPNSDGEGAGPEGVQVVGDKAVFTGSIYYDASTSQDRSLLMTQWPIADVTKPVPGTPWRSVKDLGEGIVAGPIGLIPEKWRTALKGDIITGQSGGLPIIGRQSFGPCAVSLWSKDLLDVSDVPATLLLGYLNGKEIPGTKWGGPANDLWNNSTVINSITFVGDNVVFIGSHGYGPGCYGGGVDDLSKVITDYCYDPTNASKGTHAYPYRIQAWVYAAQDLADVAAGKKQPWELPVTWLPVDFPIFDHPYYKQAPGTLPRLYIIGADYDSEACELCVGVFSQDSYGYEPGPLFHVFRVDGVLPYPNPKTTAVVTTPTELETLRAELAAVKTKYETLQAAVKQFLVTTEKL